MEFHKRGQHHDLIMELKLKSMFYKFSDIYNEETLASGQLNQFRQRFNELRGHIYHSNNAVQIQSVDLLAAQSGNNGEQVCVTVITLGYALEVGLEVRWDGCCSHGLIP